MALPRSRPTLAMLVAEADTKRALEFAVREHERQVAAQEELDMRRSLGPGTGPGGSRVQPPRRATTDAPQLHALGRAQSAPLHRQDMRRYSPQQAAPPQLDAAQQEALDAQLDYNREWITRDEAGNTRLARQPLSAQGLDPTPAAVDRGLASLEVDRYMPKPAKKQKPLRRTI